MEKDMTQSKAPFRKHSLVLEGRARAKLAGVTAGQLLQRSGSGVGNLGGGGCAAGRGAAH